MELLLRSGDGSSGLSWRDVSMLGIYFNTDKKWMLLKKDYAGARDHENNLPRKKSVDGMFSHRVTLSRKFIYIQIPEYNQETFP